MRPSRATRAAGAGQLLRGAARGRISRPPSFVGRRRHRAPLKPQRGEKVCPLRERTFPPPARPGTHCRWYCSARDLSAFSLRGSHSAGAPSALLPRQEGATQRTYRQPLRFPSAASVSRANVLAPPTVVGV